MAQRPRPSVLFALALLILPLLERSASAALDEVAEAIVGVRAEVPVEARTAGTLGRERRGSGVLIDDSGLVLTIGYLILEASAVDLRSPTGARVPADVVAYDHESGFGLVRASVPLDGKPLALGDSDSVRPGDPLLVLANVDGLGGLPAKLADRRAYAGYWEYLLEDALFTTPPFPLFGGAALIDREGRLVGIGSLAVNDAAGAGLAAPGNMFVPVNTLKPLLGDLLAFGRRPGPARPWIGVYGHEVGGRVVIAGVAPDSPAAQAGVSPGDMVVAVGDTAVAGLAGFYRALWAGGEAGATVELRVLRPGRGVLSVPVASTDRLRWLRLRHSF
jgi:S1-C subfamily serine protease